MFLLRKHVSLGTIATTKSHHALIMKGVDFQRVCTHGIPPTTKVHTQRISFTFRKHDKTKEEALYQKFHSRKRKIIRESCISQNNTLELQFDIWIELYGKYIYALIILAFHQHYGDKMVPARLIDTAKRHAYSKLFCVVLGCVSKTFSGARMYIHGGYLFRTLL